MPLTDSELVPITLVRHISGPYTFNSLGVSVSFFISTWKTTNTSDLSNALSSLRISNKKLQCGGGHIRILQ